MFDNPYNRYKQTSVMTASAGDLTLMLYDGCLKQIRLARKFIDQNETECKNTAFQKAQSILSELMSTLDMKYEVSNNLFNIYEFIFRLLVNANITNDKKNIDDALELLTELRETWVEAVNINRKGLNHG